MAAVDKKEKSIYVWYSGATDATGRSIAEAIGAQHGDKAPTKSFDTIICWGAKTSDQVTLGATEVLNHPNNIRNNRNKLMALDLMKKSGVKVAPFIETSKVGEFSKISGIGTDLVFPLIGRTKYHQGGKGFWYCPNITQAKAAVASGAEYFQNMIEIVDEFRLHVFRDKVIYAVKKVKRTEAEMAEAYIKQELDRQKSLAEKNKNPFDMATAELILRRQADKFAQNGADMLLRSNRLGWKFSKIKDLDKNLELEAIKAVKAVGLTFGAVDCCIDANRKAWVIEVNSGPGLEESTFDIWVKTIKEAISPKTAVKKETAPDVKEVTKSKGSVSNMKEELKKKVSSMSTFMDGMLEAADTENEVKALSSVFDRMFSKK